MKRLNYLILSAMMILLAGCTDSGDTMQSDEQKISQEQTAAVTNTDQNETPVTAPAEEPASDEPEEEEPAAEEPKAEEPPAQPEEERFAGYHLIDVDGGDLSGTREPNTVVDIGYGDREYWGFTNEHGQLVRVTADEIIPQDDSNESVTSSGRYYSDEAKVPGVESPVLDEGHVIADSLGGVSNAYNITPQDSVLNRHGDQAYMEKVIRTAGGATDFEAIITYQDTETQIPSHYHYTYTVKGNQVTEDFDNENPDSVNESLGLTGNGGTAPKNESQPSAPSTPSAPAAPSSEEGDLSSVDANGNGMVTIAEAKAAGFSMPITSDHWLYKYMRDNDHDGMVGE